MDGKGKSLMEAKVVNVERSLILVKWGLKGNDEDIKRGSKEDKRLVDFLSSWIEKNKKVKDIEVFEQNGNIAATSIGFLGAFREKDLSKYF